MEIEPAPFRFLEVEGKCVKLSAAAQPDEAVAPDLDVGLENMLVLFARNRRCAVRGNYQIILAGVVVGIGDFGLEDEFHAEVGRALLQDLQQPDAGDPAKAVATRSDPVAFEENIDIVPVAEGTRDVRVGLRIHASEPVHCFVGKHDAPTERIVGRLRSNDGYVP